MNSASSQFKRPREITLSSGLLTEPNIVNYLCGDTVLVNLMSFYHVFQSYKWKTITSSLLATGYRHTNDSPGHLVLRLLINQNMLYT